MAHKPDRDNAPPVQRLRIQHAKRGRLRFTSHRDFQRAFERALRRADVPMAYSSGFSPHPRVSYANASPTGVASEAEYVEIGVVQECDPIKVKDALQAVLPPDFDILDVVPATTRDFVERLEASHWQVELPEVTTDQAQHAVETFLAASEALVTRRAKSGMRTFDTRAAVLRATVLPATVLPAAVLHGDGLPVSQGTDEAGPCAILALVVRHGTPTVRPDDVLTALSQVAELELPVPARITRLAQGPLLADGWSVGDPLAADRG